MNASPTSHKSEFRTMLLPSTLAWAQRFRFYRDLWPADAARRIQTPDDLRLLPLVDKEMYQQGLENEYARDDMPVVISHSTGTTGRPTFRFRGSREIAFIREFFTEARRPDPENAQRSQPLILNIITGYHGARIPLPSSGYVLQAGATDDILLDQTLDMLYRSFEIPGVDDRISHVVGSLSFFKIITQALIERDLNPAETGVRFLHSTGEHISPTWRDILQKQWKALVVDTYSISEIFGSAGRCLHCGLYHPDTHILPEVVDPFTREPIAEGMGILVLSELYPFSQMQPLVRYWTGDLIMAHQGRCDTGNLAFDFLGRMKYAVTGRFDGIDTILITPVSVYNALDAEPCITRENIYTNIEQVTEHSLGHPLASIKVESAGERLHIRLMVDLSIPHLLLNEQHRLLLDRIRIRILEENAPLQRHQERGDVIFDVVAGTNGARPWEVESALADVR